jgi:hypothetical protein
MKMHNARKPRVKGRHRPNVPQDNFNNLAIDIDKIDTRCRHNAQFIRQFVDKFNNLAREMLSSGDRVAAEGFHQHADHYQRLLNERLQERIAQERVAAEKVQREAMEGQNESRNVYPIDAAIPAKGPATRNSKPAPAVDTVAPTASVIATV